MLVLFLHDDSKSSTRTGPALSFVTVLIDHDTGPDAAMCDCHKRNGTECNSVAIKKPSDDPEPLFAQIYEASTMSNWDVTRLGIEKRREWPADAIDGPLIRVSIQFDSPKERAYFSGFPCRCITDAHRYRVRSGVLHDCLQSGHQGLFGRVKEFGRQGLEAWRRAREDGEDVVNGPPPAENEL
jgi:hypothetical protein